MKKIGVVVVVERAEREVKVEIIEMWVTQVVEVETVVYTIVCHYIVHCKTH